MSSWPLDPARGSGTTAALQGLVRGLEELGHRVEMVVPSHGGSEKLLSRLHFNVRLALEPPRHLDVLVGVDVDGVGLRSGVRPIPDLPYIVLLKGISADEARFERGLSSLRLQLLARLEALNARHADRVVVPSHYSAGEAISRYGLDPSRVAVVPEGVELSAAGPAAPWCRPAAHPTVLTVGRQYPRKRTNVLLRAVPGLRERIPDVKVRVVGGGPELPTLRRLAATLRVEEAVQFLGPVDRTTLQEEYRQAWCFCLPSEQEAFGIVLMEAMTFGLPVVACHVAAVPEVVEHGRTGLLVEPGKPEALGDALETFLRDGRLRERMGRAALRRSRDGEPRLHAERFLEVLGSVVPLEGPSRRKAARTAER